MFIAFSISFSISLLKICIMYYCKYNLCFWFKSKKLAFRKLFFRRFSIVFAAGGSTLGQLLPHLLNDHCVELSRVCVILKPIITIKTTGSAGGFLCGYKPGVPITSKEVLNSPPTILHFPGLTLKGHFLFAFSYLLTRERVNVLI